MIKLVLIDSCENFFNKQNRIAGWYDVGLSQQGIEQAKNIANKINNQNIKVDYAFMSVLIRAEQTYNSFVKELGYKVRNFKSIERRSQGLVGPCRLAAPREVFHIKVKLLIFLLNLFGINFYQKYSSYEYTKKGIFLQRSKDFCRIRCAFKELDSYGFIWAVSSEEVYSGPKSCCLVQVPQQHLSRCRVLFCLWGRFLRILDTLGTSQSWHQ